MILLSEPELFTCEVIGSTLTLVFRTFMKSVNQRSTYKSVGFIEYCSFHLQFGCKSLRLSDRVMVINCMKQKLLKTSKMENYIFLLFACFYAKYFHPDCTERIAYLLVHYSHFLLLLG